MVAGFTAMGMDVVLTGPIPTPAIAMMTRSLRADLGVVISASHNAYQDNGVKLFGPDGYKLSDEIEAEIEDRLKRHSAVCRQQTGLAAPAARMIQPAAMLNMQKAHSRVACRWAACALSWIAPMALDTAQHLPRFWELGAEVISIGVSPNGVNINDRCGATHPEALREAVLTHRADLGVALDGDADRVQLVDEKGGIVDGDQLLAVIAEGAMAEGRLRGGGVVATQMSNLGLERYLERRGLTLARTQVGDRYVVEHMRAHGFNVGGEQSGHIVLSDFTTTGDGLIAGLQATAAITTADKPASEVLHRFEPMPQVLKNVRYEGATPLEMAAVLKAVEEAEVRLQEVGRLLIRKSGTEPLIRVMAEGDDPAIVSDVVDELVGIIAATQKA